VSPCAQLVIVRYVFLLLSVYCGQLLEHAACLAVLFMCHFYIIYYCSCERNKMCAWRHNMLPSPVTLTFDLLTLKVVSESRMTCATSAPILVFLGLSVLDLGPM